MPALFGRVPFGRVNNDPRMIMTQLLYLTSLFFMLLGVSIISLEVWQGFMSVGDPATAATSSGGRSAAAHVSDDAQRRHFGVLEASAGHESNSSNNNRNDDPLSSRRGNRMKGHAVEAESAKGGNEGADEVGDVKSNAQHNKFDFGTYAPKPTLLGGASLPDYKRYLHANFYVSFTTLFVPTAIGESTSAISADAKFVLAHLVTAVLLCYPAALCVERRKFVLDFVFSLYALYILGAFFVTQTLFQPFTFWMATVVSAIVSLAGTTQIAYRREMAEVLISNEDAMATVTTNASPSSSAAKQGGGGLGASKDNISAALSSSQTASGAIAGGSTPSTIPLGTTAIAIGNS